MIKIWSLLVKLIKITIQLYLRVVVLNFLMIQTIKMCVRAVNVKVVYLVLYTLIIVLVLKSRAQWFNLMWLSQHGANYGEVIE